MSEQGPPQKKQKTCGLPVYFLQNNPYLEKSNANHISMNEMLVTKNTKSIYTTSCTTCAALIIVVKMANGEIWHGMRHEMTATNTDDIRKGFTILMTKVINETEGEIMITKHYLVTATEYKNKRSKDVKHIGYPVTICFSSVDIPQQENFDSVMSLDRKSGTFSSVDVKLSDSLIEMKCN